MGKIILYITGEERCGMAAFAEQQIRQLDKMLMAKDKKDRHTDTPIAYGK